MKRLFSIFAVLVAAGCVGTGSIEAQVCEPMEKFCKGQDVFICQADGVNFEFVKTCGEGEECQSGECVPEGTCAAACDGKECGDDGCDGTCGQCGADEHCEGGHCADGPCEPDCAGKECGDDGCGGNCGECSADDDCSGLECVDGLCEALCAPDCEGKECGDDGCGCPCGECAAGWGCVEGKCEEGVCTPNCLGKECGDNGCGGKCGECGEGENCQEGVCVDGPCVPKCEGKECGSDGCDGKCGDCDEGKLCMEGSCLCEFADCNGVCCPEGQACHESVCCTPTCAEVECGDDGCGGLCNGCLDIVYDDGSTETAYGYGEAPGHAPTQVVCVVRFDLPQKNMKLTRFTAGWMWGLYNLQVPFELVYVTPEDMECDQGGEGIWYKEWCKTEPDKLVSIGDFLPLEPYTPMEQAEIGEVVFPSETVYLAAVFDIDQYPFYVCPMDDSGEGDYAFMMSDHIVAGDKVVIQGASFHTQDENKGVIPFSIRVETTE